MDKWNMISLDVFDDIPDFKVKRVSNEYDLVEEYHYEKKLDDLKFFIKASEHARLNIFNFFIMFPEYTIFYDMEKIVKLCESNHQSILSVDKLFVYQILFVIIMTPTTEQVTRFNKFITNNNFYNINQITELFITFFGSPYVFAKLSEDRQGYEFGVYPPSKNFVDQQI